MHDARNSKEIETVSASRVSMVPFIDAHSPLFVCVVRVFSFMLVSLARIDSGPCYIHLLLRFCCSPVQGMSCELVKDRQPYLNDIKVDIWRCLWYWVLNNGLCSCL